MFQVMICDLWHFHLKNELLFKLGIVQHHKNINHKSHVNMYITFSRGEGGGAILLLNKATPLAHIVKALNGDQGHAIHELSCNRIAPTIKLPS